MLQTSCPTCPMNAPMLPTPALDYPTNPIPSVLIAVAVAIHKASMRCSHPLAHCALSSNLWPFTQSPCSHPLTQVLAKGAIAVLEGAGVSHVLGTDGQVVGPPQGRSTTAAHAQRSEAQGGGTACGMTAQPMPPSPAGASALHTPASTLLMDVGVAVCCVRCQEQLRWAGG